MMSVSANSYQPSWACLAAVVSNRMLLSCNNKVSKKSSRFILKFKRVLVRNIRAKFDLASCSSSWVIVVTEKQTNKIRRNDAENNIVVTAANINKSHRPTQPGHPSVADKISTGNSYSQHRKKRWVLRNSRSCCQNCWACDGILTPQSVKSAGC